MDDIITGIDDLNNVEFFCKGKKVKYEIDKCNPLKLVNPIDGIMMKIPIYKINYDKKKN